MVVLSVSYVDQLIGKLKNCNSLGRFISEAKELLLSSNLYDEKDRARLISYININERRKTGRPLIKKERFQEVTYRRYFIEKWGKEKKAA